MFDTNTEKKKKWYGRTPLLLCMLWLFFLPMISSAQYKDSIVTIAAGKQYLKSNFHQFWWGRHYRKVWAQPIEVSVFRLSQFKGGVIPVRQGGSFQTKNLRLQDSLGREYVVRSIDKDPSVALPVCLQKTFLANLMRDQTSVIHPYGAFIVPALAHSAGVYHTNPTLVFIADDVALGAFKHEFANTMALLEERPDGNWQDLNSFGNPERVLSSKKAFENLLKRPDHQVETKRYLTSRLFDMWLSDWSRREDQWRWGVTKQKDSVQYAPIPRDRDHAFFKFNDGLLTKLVSVFKPNYQSFDGSIVGKNVQGLIKSSKRMDAYFLAYLPRQAFEAAARELQLRLNDEVIAKALQQWPAPIRELSANEFATKLKSRRNDLPQAATAFYQEINKEVFLPGSDERDLFHLHVHTDGSVTIQQWSHAKQAEKRLWHQKTFYPAETKSISIFGLGEEDELHLSGQGKNRISITWYGGQGTDKLAVEESWKVTGKKLLVLDEQDGNDYAPHPGIKLQEHSPKANEFSADGWLLRHRLH